MANINGRNNVAMLEALERRILWLASWTIHNANHIRPNIDGLKVGGHQSSCASAATLMTALYLSVLRPEDRVAVKPHASPVFHAIQYLLGKQSREKLENFRAFGGAQSYPSRTKDSDDVDFSTGSVGLGVGVTLFASLLRDYVHLHGLAEGSDAPGRMVAIMGDAELDEGNVFEALLEGWKHDVRNLWWVIDYNRHSLDGVVNDHLFGRIRDFFGSVGWNVVELKYGKRLEAAFEGPAGGALRQWIDDCPNQHYSALTFMGGAAWRERLKGDLAGTSGLAELLDGHDDAALHRLMTNLGGHDMETVLEAFHGVGDDRPHCFIAYTIKGNGLPLAGHKDNHAGLMNPQQMEAFRALHNVPEGEEWEPFAGMEIAERQVRAFLADVPFARREARAEPSAVPVPAIAAPAADSMSTQDAFGHILNELGKTRDELTRRIVTTSPDVAISTNLAGWINRRGVFHRDDKPDAFREQSIASPLKWDQGPAGQHIELGIAENNLFLMLAAAGISDRLFGARVIPVGTLYDPFVARGLDSLNYACYMDARFIVVGTPSGIALAPEGGAHQSVSSPLIGIAQDGLAAFEPAFADELAAIMEWAFDYVQRDGSGESGIEWLRDVEGGAVYLRLSTRTIEQPKREIDAATRHGIMAGGYWLREPAPGAEIAIAYTGAVAPEALAAWEQLIEDSPGAGLLAVTSADRLGAGWHAAERARQHGEGIERIVIDRTHDQLRESALHHKDRADSPGWWIAEGDSSQPGSALGARSHVERLLEPLAPDAGIVTVTDGHPEALSWIGGVLGHRVKPLGVEHFGQSGNLPDLFRHYRIDADAILDACAAALIGRKGVRVVPKAAE